MDATTFMAELSWKNSTENLTASEYFTTAPGRSMLKFIGLKVNLINSASFTLNSGNISIINSQPLYKGRDFVSDMVSLGFSYEIAPLIQKENASKTYVFKVAKT